ncbi:hypothetical protein BDV96DRAFT_570352 [Lophiotrema nucula]|uniref:Uncharacterized protein n=1 Tax=Lophiotrema nucula TaxID=690887 RepID=A0A6A5ZGL2_9PLEO|nr:hypothetical protein BDV96DRAFT_570352 [Lophiotrema nucula]
MLGPDGIKDIAKMDPREGAALLEAHIENFDGEAAMTMWLQTKPKILYKGGARSRFAAAFHPRENKFEVEVLFSKAPTDFHPTCNQIFYFGEELELALKYAWWAENRVPAEAACVLQVALPASKMSEGVYVDDAKRWERLVWHSRRVDSHGQPLEAAPDTVVSLLNERILVGPICGMSPHVVQGLPRGGWQRLTKIRLSNNQNATQVVFMNPRTFVERCEEILWVLSSVSWRGNSSQDLLVMHGLRVQPLNVGQIAAS